MTEVDDTERPKAPADLQASFLLRKQTTLNRTSKYFTCNPKVRENYADFSRKPIKHPETCVNGGI